MASGAAVLGLNGSIARSPPSNLLRLESFYEKLLQLQHDVLAGQHPRLKISEPLIRGRGNEADEEAETRAPPQARAPKLSTTIDPILLVKSDDLIRAETRIKRQRIERSLKDEALRTRSSHKDLVDEDIDVSELLTRAQQLEPPVSGFKQPMARKNSPSSESFDENSYYSSKANSWSTDKSKDKGDARDSDAMAISSEGEISSNPASEPAIRNRQMAMDSVISRPYEGATQPLDVLHTDIEMNPDLEDSDEESDYSPPAPDAVDQSTEALAALVQNAAKSLFAQSFSQSAMPATAAYPLISPPSQPPRVPQYATALVQDHAQSPMTFSLNGIQSPAAPQPSRISPLALTKMPQTPQYQDFKQGTNGNSSRQEQDTRNSWNRKDKRAAKQSRRSSPAGRGQIQNPKKRRRQEPEELGKRSKRVLRSPASRSPEPHIKKEPVTPPPMAQQRDPLYPQPSGAARIERAAPTYYRQGPSSDPRAVFRHGRSGRAYSPPSPQEISQPVNIPPGYKLVPILNEQAHVEPIYPVYLPPALPKPRPVLVDQDGNEYFAEPPRAYRASVAQRSYSDAYYDRAATQEPPSWSRAQYQSQFEDEGVYQRMPPPLPPPPTRRFADRPGTAAPDFRAYAERTYSMRPADAAPVHEPRPLDEAYPGEAFRAGRVVPGQGEAYLHEYIPRAYSVHPQVAAGGYLTRQEMTASRDMAPPIVQRAVSVYPQRANERQRYAAPTPLLAPAPPPPPPPPPPPQHRRMAGRPPAEDPYAEMRRVSSRF